MASMGPHFNECGNHPLGLRGGQRLQDASMGPHFNECGNSILTLASSFCLVALQWGRTSMSAETPDTAKSRTGSQTRFNGTAQQLPFALLQWGRTSMSAETVPTGDNPYFTAYVLQWGRTSMSAETAPGGVDRPPFLGASMGPHFNECGNSSSARLTPPPLDGFNGAALQ